jgi:Ran GTPase-activating protein (RanGAP) involved in mRNA processing and transport
MVEHANEIERILSGPPSKIAFRALCAAIGRSRAPEDLLARCAQGLKSWPDQTRDAHWPWLAGLEAGFSKPAWPLVRSLSCGVENFNFWDIVEPALPDPRQQPEVRAVSHLDLGWPPKDRLAALADSLEHWENLRAIKTGLVFAEGFNEVHPIQRIAGNAAISRIESLTMVDLRKRLDDYRDRFRPAGQLLRLRHAGLYAADLVYLMRSGLVPELRSADVVVFDLGEARELAGCAQLAQLDRLAIGFQCGSKKVGVKRGRETRLGRVVEEDDEACAVFFANANLANLRSLTVQGSTDDNSREGLGARGVDTIVANPVLRQLTDLTIGLLPLGDEAVAHVIEAVDPNRIENLTLADLVATNTMAAAFVAAQAFPRLRRLDLSRNLLDEQGARALATEVAFPALTHLDLSGTADYPYSYTGHVQPIGDAGAAAWASSPNAAQLQRLTLSSTGLGVEGVGAVMNLNVEHLDLDRNPLGSWPTMLRDAPAWRTLRTLNLTECGLDDEAMESLASTAAAPHLHGISLEYNSIGTAGVTALAGWSVLPRLWKLDLADNVIGGEGIMTLATSAAAQTLLELDLEQDYDNAQARKYGAPVLRAVLDKTSFPNLEVLNLDLNGCFSEIPTRIWKKIAVSSDTRPELAAIISDFIRAHHAYNESPDEDDVDELFDASHWDDLDELYVYHDLTDQHDDNQLSNESTDQEDGDEPTNKDDEDEFIDKSLHREAAWDAEDFRLTAPDRHAVRVQATRDYMSRITSR